MKTVDTRRQKAVTSDQRRTLTSFATQKQHEPKIIVVPRNEQLLKLNPSPQK